MLVALDAMGGDFAPRELVAGAVKVVNQLGLQVLLVGQPEIIREEIAYQIHMGNIEPGRVETSLEVVPASQVIAMDEEPVFALRKKKDASIAVATQLVKAGRADAVVSAGSTGAQMVAALLILGRMPGVERPAIATVLPGLTGPKVLLDSGANVDCRPKHLEQFAMMGSALATAVLGLNNPNVGLINVGEEESKGNELTKQTYQLLKQAPLNFIGNVEGRDFFSGSADILVCDGFVGNIILKLAEGLSETIFQLLKNELVQLNSAAPTSGAALLPGLQKLKNRMDYTEYGGAPLLGVKGISIICHGSSKAQAIYNAIRAAKESADKDLIGRLTVALQQN
jgi:glycerol-3-phosphate acyltransferase PlsX